MLLTEFLSKSHIIPELEVETVAEAVNELGELLLRRPGTCPLEPKRRARNGNRTPRQGVNVNVSNGLALAHTRVERLGGLICALGRVRSGLHVNGHNGTSVKLIVLSCYPGNGETAYLNFAATLEHVFQDALTHAQVLAAANAPEIFSILREASALLGAPAQPEKERRLSVLWLARLQLCSEMLETAGSRRPEIERSIEAIAARLDPGVLEYYRRIKGKYRRAVVLSERGICQGCRMALPSELVQRTLRDRNRVHSCTHCHRFVYAV